MERLISRCTVHVDTIPKTYCSATGKHYESRSEMRDELKAIGAVAVDKDWSPKKKVKKEEEVQREIMDDLQAAARDIRYGNSNDLTEAEKAECRELDEKDGYKPIKF